MGKGNPFLEVLSSALHEDYRFPILEIFAFLYAVSTFVFANFGPVMAPHALPSEARAYSLTSSILGTPLFIFIILIFKNVAYGFGNDLEKGIIQTYFSYPLKRHQILSAKLLSAIGVALALFLSIQTTALYVLAPDIVLPYLDTVLLTYVANVSPSLLLTGIILLVTVRLRRGGLALIIGVVLYFVLSIVGAMATFVAFSTNSPLALQMVSVISPGFGVLSAYYGFSGLWWPTYSEVLVYIGASYVVVAGVFFVGYLYFCRRLGL